MKRSVTQRSLHLERLDARRLLASDYQNVYQPLDVNDDLRVSALDVLTVLNHLARQRAVGSQTREAGFLDVDGNGQITSLDALRVINSLRKDHSVVRLINDTAPGNTTNRDLITSDLEIEGRIDWPDTLPTQQRHAYLTATSSARSTSLALDDYIDGDYFRVPGSQMARDLGSVVTSYTFIHEMQLALRLGDNSGPDLDSDPLSEVTIGYDDDAPNVFVPSWIGVETNTVRLHVEDDLPVVVHIDHPLHFEIGEHKLPFDWQSNGSFLAIDLAIGEIVDAQEDVLTILADGVVEDLAGNQTKLPRRLVVQHGQVESTLPSLPQGPSSGVAFDADGIVANPGQLIRLPQPPDGARLRLVFPAVGTERQPNSTVKLTGSTYTRTSFNFDPFIGEAVYRLKDYSVSGVIRTSDGRFVAELSIVPDRVKLDVIAGQWANIGLGGIDPTEFRFHYRLIDPSNPDSSVDLSREAVAQWPILVPGQAAPTFGFQQIQVAGDAGVSAPYDTGLANPNLGRILSVVEDQDGEHLWLSAANTVVKIESASGQVVTSVDFSPLQRLDLQGVDHQQFSVHALQLVPASLLSQSATFVDGFEPLDYSGDLLVSFADDQSGADALIDPVGGVVVGILNREHRRMLLESDNLTPIFHPQRQSWFTVTQDGRYWREYSVATGELLNEELAIGLQSAIDLDQLLWDSRREQVVIFGKFMLADEVNSGLKTFAFDFESASFRNDTTYPRFSFRVGPGDYATNISMDGQGRVVVSSRRGTLRRWSLAEPADVTPVLAEIASIAAIGEPADPLVASANPKQVIELRGENLDATNLRVDFPARYISGNPREKTFSVQPFRVSEDGAQAWVRVPSEAVSGPIRITNTAAAHFLQIVPVARNAQSFSGEAEPSSRFRLSGTGVDEYGLRIDGELVNICVDLHSSKLCDDVYLHETLPIIRESIEVSTDGGKTLLRVDNQQAYDGDRWQINSLTSSRERFASRFAFSVQGEVSSPSDVTLNAASWIYFDIAAKTNQGSNDIDDLVLPDRLTIELTSQSASGPRRYQSVLAVLQGETSQYRMYLPVDFPGGEIAIQGAAETDSRLTVAVVPTVIAVTGDSAKAGSSVLFAGTNLLDADFSIDGISVATEDFSEASGEHLQVIRIEVPADVTEGVVRVSRNGIVAKSDRIEPWWIEGQMPAPVQGIATFQDLPAVNAGQSLQVRLDTPPDEFYFYVLSDNFAQLRNAYVVVSTSGSQNVLEYKGVNGRSVFVFRDQSTLHWNILPIIPRAPQWGVESTELCDYCDPRESITDVVSITFEYERYSSFEQLSIEWGDQVWREELGDGIFTFSPTVPSVRVVQETNGSVRYYGANAEFERDAISTFPRNTLRVSTPWGSTETIVNHNNSFEEVASSLRADSGTPADPTLPSVNPEQLILLPEESAANLQALFFLPSPDVVSEAAPAGLLRWHGAQVRDDWAPGGASSAQVRVPRRATSGTMRFGLFGSDYSIQVVPTLSINVHAERGLLVDAYGADESSVLRIGDKEFPLSKKDFRVNLQTLIVVSVLDPRFSELTQADFAGGLQLVTRGGASKIHYPKMITHLVPQGSVPVFDEMGVLVVQPGQVIRVEGGGLAGFDRLRFSPLHVASFGNVASDGQWAEVTVPEISLDQIEAIESVRLETSDDVYWFLESLRIRITV